MARSVSTRAPFNETVLLEFPQTATSAARDISGTPRQMPLKVCSPAGSSRRMLDLSYGSSR
jgi:hypothetical protein